MKRLSDFLQNNPVINVSMFGLTVISIVMGLVLGWDEFYNDYLSKTIELPIWFVVLVIVVGVFLWIYFGTRKATARKELEKVFDKVYGVERVELCGRRFDRCRFSGSELVFDGSDSCELTNNNFDVPPRISFAGAASRTLGFMTALYGDETFRPYIESTIQGIKDGIHPESVPPSNRKF